MGYMLNGQSPNDRALSSLRLFSESVRFLISVHS